MTLTGYLPPICDSSRDVTSGDEIVHLLVDGGYVNNLPADVMARGLGADTVIAVDVSSSSAFPSQDFGDSISGLGVLKWRLVRRPRCTHADPTATPHPLPHRPPISTAPSHASTRVSFPSVGAARAAVGEAPLAGADDGFDLDTARVRLF